LKGERKSKKRRGGGAGTGQHAWGKKKKIVHTEAVYKQTEKTLGRRRVRSGVKGKGREILGDKKIEYNSEPETWRKLRQGGWGALAFGGEIKEKSSRRSVAKKRPPAIPTPPNQDDSLIVVKKNC